MPWLLSRRIRSSYPIHPFALEGHDFPTWSAGTALDVAHSSEVSRQLRVASIFRQLEGAERRGIGAADVENDTFGIPDAPWTIRISLALIAACYKITKHVERQTVSISQWLRWIDFTTNNGVPDPAFIAASAASQIVTNDHDSQSEIWFDQHGIEPSGETALVAPPALRLLNRFLDQLLFNFLSVSRSTSLAALRPAVYEVLKQKLAKDAIQGAEQELHEYLGSSEDEELLSSANEQSHSGNWDLELVWKRTRLRCMVYSSLGDMEEEDEDFYTEQEHLEGPKGTSGEDEKGVVSPAVAIFLTSILEFMGEQVLVIAGQAAYHRLRAKHEKEEKEGTSTHGEIAERVVVKDSDMERVALDRTLGRLWRGWKKRIRSPTTSVSMGRSFSRDSLRSQPQASRNGSIAHEDHPSLAEKLRGQSLASVLNEHEHAANIPLPISNDDVREIEIPGLAEQSDDEDDDSPEEEEDIKQAVRPRSMIGWRAPVDSEDHRSTSPISKLFAYMPPFIRRRSNSLPSRPPAPYRSQMTKEIAAVPGAFLEDESEQEDVAEADRDENEGDSTPRVVNGALVEVTPDAKVLKAKPLERVDTAKETDKGVLSKVAAAATTVGAAAVTGIAAAAHREAPQTHLVHEESDPEDDLTEEPQILTSSRVSINGSISPDDAKALSRPSSVRSPSVRSSSVHSLRLIDVPASKSPIPFRQDGADSHDLVATGSPIYSRPRSIQSTALTDANTTSSPVSRAINASPLGRNGSPASQRQVRNSAGESISEVDEKEHKEAYAAPVAAITAAAATTALVAGAVKASDIEASPTAASRTVALQRQPFVLSAAPAPRAREAAVNQPESMAHPLSNQATDARSYRPEHGVSPLRVKKEPALAPAAVTSPPPRTEARMASERVVNGHSPSLSASSPIAIQRTNESGKLARHSSAHVTRSSPPRSSRDDSYRKNFHEPIPKRSTHTSGSGSSSNSHKVRPLRPSEDSGSHSSEDKSKSFEQLIRSDQTIQYTLTPQNMRNIEAGPDSPRQANNGVVPNEVQRPPTGRSHSSSVGRTTGLHSNPPTNVNRSSQSQKPFKPVPRPYSNTGTKLRPNAPQPRDARIDRDSMGDFAEFIRSTGPSSDNGMAPRPLGVNNHRGTTGTTRNVSGSIPRVSDVTPLPKRTESDAGGRRKLQARDAVVPRGDSISDLIDFVRSGPQLEKEDHRIPRTVAPFRTTMDSDQMSGAVGGKAIDANLPDPRYSQATASIDSSVNSTSALLNSSSGNRHPQVPNQFDEEDVMPKRKTRRVRDPYAIDLSDEDEEQYQAASRPKAIEEESLADFLRNVPPPPDAVATSVFESRPKPPGKDIKKKGSATGLMSRFGRSNSSSPAPTPNSKFTTPDPRSASSRNNVSPALISAKYTSSNTYDSNHPGNSYVSQLDSARNKVAQKSYQPREAVYSNTRTSDLADFLMRSEPPPSMDTQPGTPKEESGAFQRMFGRKKFIERS